MSALDGPSMDKLNPPYPRIYKTSEYSMHQVLTENNEKIVLLVKQNEHPEKSYLLQINKSLLFIPPTCVFSIHCKFIQLIGHSIGEATPGDLHLASIANLTLAHIDFEGAVWDVCVIAINVH